MNKGVKRFHRLVVLPEYQGLGIGTSFITEIARQYKIKGWDVLLTTTTPALSYSLNKSIDWGLIRKGRIKASFAHLKKNNGLQNTASQSRITYSFKYTPSFDTSIKIE